MPQRVYAPPGEAGRDAVVRPDRQGEVMELTGLRGQVAVVTGAARARGIGRDTAVVLAQSGCSVVVTGRKSSRLPEDEAGGVGSGAAQGDDGVVRQQVGRTGGEHAVGPDADGGGGSAVVSRAA